MVKGADLCGARAGAGANGKAHHWRAPEPLKHVCTSAKERHHEGVHQAERNEGFVESVEEVDGPRHLYQVAAASGILEGRGHPFAIFPWHPQHLAARGPHTLIDDGRGSASSIALDCLLLHVVLRKPREGGHE